MSRFLFAILLAGTAEIAVVADSLRVNNPIHFESEGPGEIVATDNGDPTSFESFSSHDRKAFNGLCLVIVRGIARQPGEIKLTVTADGLKTGALSIATALNVESVGR